MRQIATNSRYQFCFSVIYLLGDDLSSSGSDARIYGDACGGPPSSIAKDVYK